MSWGEHAGGDTQPEALRHVGGWRGREYRPKALFPVLAPTRGKPIERHRMYGSMHALTRPCVSIVAVLHDVHYCRPSLASVLRSVPRGRCRQTRTAHHRMGQELSKYHTAFRWHTAVSILTDDLDEPPCTRRSRHVNLVMARERKRQVCTSYCTLRWYSIENHACMHACPRQSM